MNKKQNSDTKIDVRDYQGLVRHIARKEYKRNYFVRQIGDFDDVISIGNLGLLKAIQLYSPDKDVQFVTYAACKIRYAILDAARDVGFIRIPRTAQQLGEKEKEVVRFQAYKYKEGREEIQLEPISKPKKEVSHDIELLLSLLQPKHAVFLIRYFGLDGQPEMTLKQIAKKINMSEPHVAQQVNPALNFARQCKIFINSGLQEAG